MMQDTTAISVLFVSLFCCGFLNELQFSLWPTTNPPYVSIYYTCRTTTGNLKPKLSGVASFTWQNASHNLGTVSPISCGRREVLAYLFSQEAFYPCSCTDDTVVSKKQKRESFQNSGSLRFFHRDPMFQMSWQPIFSIVETEYHS